MENRKRALPDYLVGRVTLSVYDRWLARKAAAHLKRDRKRGHAATAAAYRDAIHDAVVASGGRDRYTGEELAWNLISTYNNEESEAGRHHYKAQFA